VDLVGLGDLDPRVRHTKGNLGLVGRLAVYHQLDLAFVGELHRVLGEVHEDLAKPTRVAEHGIGYKVANPDRKIEPLLVGMGFTTMPNPARTPRFASGSTPARTGGPPAG